MSNKRDDELTNQFVQDLFSREWKGLLRYAKIQLRNHGIPNIDIEGRAEDAVQELFCTVCDKADQIKKMETPEKWLYAALYYKLKEVIKEDRKWLKCWTALPIAENIEPNVQLDDELLGIVKNEDYLLLRKLYIEGYTYKELCGELGISKSLLGVRIYKIKKAFREIYEKI